ncbi:MAG: Flp pilus assembly protein CpaB [Chloroflexi bacterium]|nr:Flp pilus assembly protein CpaB [Chloroflexota bacterium]
MRRGGRILILLGIVLGVLTAGGTFFVLSTATPEGQQIPTRSVVIAQQNISDRTEIAPEAIGKADWPEAFLPPGAFENTNQVTGKLAVQAIYQGQIILPQMILDKTQVKETRSNASFLVPEGKVAVAFPLSSLSGVAGALQNGDTVDLLLTLSPAVGVKPITATTTSAGGEGQPVAQLMLQDVLVLNIGPWPGSAGTAEKQGNAPAPANIVTFALDRQDSLALKAAREQGTVDLVLRRAGDHKPVTTEPVNLQYLNKRFNFNLIMPTTK